MNGSLVAALKELKSKYGFKVFFIYLAEAHALDTWPLSTSAPRSHKSLSERHAAAKAFLSREADFAAEIETCFLDGMDDALTKELGLWPERFLVLEEGAIQWANTFRDTPVRTDLEELGEALRHTFP